VCVINNSDPEIAYSLFCIERELLGYLFVFTNEAYVGRAEVTHVGLFVVSIFFYIYIVHFSLYIGLSFLVLHHYQILYTDVQIF